MKFYLSSMQKKLVSAAQKFLAEELGVADLPFVAIESEPIKQGHPFVQGKVTLSYFGLDVTVEIRLKEERYGHYDIPKGTWYRDFAHFVSRNKWEIIRKNLRIDVRWCPVRKQYLQPRCK